MVFTTIQKFYPDEGARYPTLSERRNIVVIADEAHRSCTGAVRRACHRGVDEPEDSERRVLPVPPPVEGGRDGRALLVEQESIADPDHGGRYTVKVYRSRREARDDGTWRHAEIILETDTDAPGYRPIVLTDMPDEAIRVVAEVVEVLPG